MSQPGVERRSAANLWVGVAWGAWVVGLVWFGLRLVSDVVSPCDYYFGDNSAKGSGSWQATPPGVACTYSDSSGSTVVQTSPGYATLVVALLLIALPLYAVASRGVRRGPTEA